MLYVVKKILKYTIVKENVYMNRNFDTGKKLFFQIGIPIIILIIPLLIPDCWTDLIKKIFESWNGTTINGDITNIIIKIIIVICLYFLINRHNNEIEFLNGDVYGNVPFFFYYIAKYLGYKKISMIRKPYDIQFKILKKGLFDVLDDEIVEDNDVKAYTNKEEFNYSNNLRECNLVIQDTYPISKEQLPESKRKFDTIWIKREKSKIGTRVYSPNLINEVAESVALIQETGATINLYLTTNTKNTEKIIKEIFMKGNRSKYDIRIFLQKADEGRNFKEKGKKV